jgi:hypothetical protein
VIKKIYELGKCPGIDIALTICQNEQYTTYQSIDRPGFPPSIEQLVSKLLDLLDESS